MFLKGFFGHQWLNPLFLLAFSAWVVYSKNRNFYARIVVESNKSATLQNFTIYTPTVAQYKICTVHVKIAHLLVACIVGHKCNHRLIAVLHVQVVCGTSATVLLFCHNRWVPNNLLPTQQKFLYRNGTIGATTVVAKTVPKWYFHFPKSLFSSKISGIR